MFVLRVVTVCICWTPFPRPPATMYTRACVRLLALIRTSSPSPLKHTKIPFNLHLLAVQWVFYLVCFWEYCTHLFMSCAIQNPQQFTTKLSIVQMYPLSVFLKPLHSPCIKMMSIMAFYADLSDVSCWRQLIDTSFTPCVCPLVHTYSALNSNHLYSPLSEFYRENNDF